MLSTMIFIALKDANFSKVGGVKIVGALRKRENIYLFDFDYSIYFSENIMCIDL